MSRALGFGMVLGVFFSLTWLVVEACGVNGQTCSACANGPCDRGVCTGGSIDRPASGGGVAPGNGGGAGGGAGGRSSNGNAQSTVCHQRQVPGKFGRARWSRRALPECCSGRPKRRNLEGLSGWEPGDGHRTNGRSGPWYQQTASGELTYNNKANLSTTPLSRIVIDEQGYDRSSVSSGDPRYWTGMDSTGQLGLNCLNWTASSSTRDGLIAQSGVAVTSAASCSEPYRLLCF
jgi:hypothetical protein